MTARYDIAIVGAGMAGASLAAHLAGKARVVMLEAEDHPGYHSTGRSAAFWTESYGGAGVQPLTAASGPDLRAGGFLSQRSALTIGRHGQEGLVEGFATEFAALGVEVALLSRGELEALIPGLRPDWVSGALEPSCSDIDVGALHHHYLGLARRAGAELRVRSRLTAARRGADSWLIETAAGDQLRSDMIVNAAGAWADRVAEICGARVLGIGPLRRTIVQLSVEPSAPNNLPLVLDVAERFYFKPESGDIWLSPHDETPCLPCDAAPEEMDVALAIDRFEAVVDWRVKRVVQRWAGLRSFAPDRLPVYGFDPAVPGFFWFAGQGGFGIQTAPAAARLGAAVLLGEGDSPVDPESFKPGRFV